MGKAGRQVRCIPSQGPHSMASFICRKHGSVPLGLGLLPVEGPGRFFVFWFFSFVCFSSSHASRPQAAASKLPQRKTSSGRNRLSGGEGSRVYLHPRTPLFRTPGERAQPLEARAGWGVGVGVVRMGSGAREPGGPTRARSDGGWGGGGEEPGSPGGGGRRGCSPPLHAGSRAREARP